MEQSKTCQMRTCLYEKHRALGGKIVDFCGWEMPIQYKGIIPEHQAVRQHVGIFDVSHMGRISIRGPDAERLLDYLSTNKIEGKSLNSATYTVWCLPDKGCVDDLIIYKQSSDHFFIVVNAGNRQKDLDHLKYYASHYNVQIVDHFQAGILAIQGPKAVALVTKIFPSAKDVKHMHFLPEMFQGEELILSRTGYTGEDGFEIYASQKSTTTLWDLFLQEGQKDEIQPIGLGARDTLRLEMGFALYGHELSETLSANESVSKWTIKWDKKDFLGKKALTKLEHHPDKRSQYGIILQDPGVAREGYEIYKKNQKIGKVTSGTFSPSLNKAIALIMVQGELYEGDDVEVQIRQNRAKAQIVKLPFWKGAP